MKAKRTSITRQIPPEIAEAIKDLQEAVNKLAKIAKHKQKKFTLDGRLIGDIGEVIAAFYFNIEINETQETGFDAIISSGPNKGKKVEVKCRRLSQEIAFKDKPDYLIVLMILDGDETVEIVYAGEGCVLERIKPLPNTYSLSQLRNQFNFDEYNRRQVIPFNNPGA